MNEAIAIGPAPVGMLAEVPGAGRWLAAAAAEGTIQTVRVSFADRLGQWRGKRVPVEHFLRREPYAMAFCDGMIVCDVQCDVIEQTPFTNYTTGYPDMHVQVDAGRVRRVGWHSGEAYVFGSPANVHGEPLAVAPVNVLRQVVDRAARLGVSLSGRANLCGAFLDGPDTPTPAGAEAATALANELLRGLVATGLPAGSVAGLSEPGAFELGLGPAAPMELAESLVVAKGAAKELARSRGSHAVFMTRRPGAAQPALLEIEATVTGARGVDPDRLAAMLRHARPLLFPSINAIRAEPPKVCTSSAAHGGHVVSCWASSEADAATALAVLVAGVGALVESVSSPGAELEPGPAVNDLAAAARLRESHWLSSWLGSDFIENSIALLEHEARIFREAVTDWEIARYWSAS